MEDLNKIRPLVYHLHARLRFSCLAYCTRSRCSIKHFLDTMKLPSFVLSFFLPSFTDLKIFNWAKSLLLHIPYVMMFILTQNVSKCLLKSKVKWNVITLYCNQSVNQLTLPKTRMVKERFGVNSNNSKVQLPCDEPQRIQPFNLSLT